jgi:hypothetical protein
MAQIADHAIRTKRLNISRIAAGPNQQPQLGALFGQNPRHMTAHEPGCASDESFHQSCQLSAISYHSQAQLLKADS